MAALIDADKARVRYHLEYPAIDANPSVVAAAIRYSDIQFALESVMNHVRDDMVAKVTRVLDLLDKVELQMEDALERLQARKADVVELNPNEHGDLLGQYEHWRTRLCNLLGTQVCSFAQKGGGATSLNFRRR